MMLLDITAAGAVLAVLLGWSVAIVSAIQLVVSHRAEGKSVGYYLPRGAIWFDRRNFAPSGVHVHRRMLVGMGVFAVGAVGVAGVIVLHG